MNEFLRFALLGVAVGSLYALTAHGLVLIYRASGVISFCQGAFGMVGAYLYYRGVEEYGWSKGLAWFVALSVPAVLGAVTHLVIMTRLRTASIVVRVVATLAVLFFLVATARHLWGENNESVTSPLPSTLHTLLGGPGAISEDRLWLILIALLVTVVLWAGSRWTPFGQATEAVAENDVAASAVGLSPNRIAMGNWAIGSILASITGILIAPIITLSVLSISYVILRALAAALVGGFRSFWWTWVGAIGIGLSESLLGRYIVDDGIFRPFVSTDGYFLGQFTSLSVARSAAFLVVIAVLVVRGRGLPSRSDLLDRLPALGTGRLRPRVLGTLALAGAVVLLVAPDVWQRGFVVSLAIAIVCLSVVVVTGFVGQLSLAQMALAGCAVWVASRLNDGQGWPLPLAAIVAVVVTVAVGVAFSIPALRTRGLSLAVLTFGLAVVVDELILGNIVLTGGLQGTRVDRLAPFGLEIDAVNHPGRYGVLVLVFLLGSCIVVSNVRRGRSGRRMIAVRDNERAAAAAGIDVAVVKVYAFALAAALAAVGGMLYAFRQDDVNFLAFKPFHSIDVLLFTVIGGVGYIMGAGVAGSFALGGVGGEIVRAFGFQPTDLDWMTGLLLIGMLLLNPDGLAKAHVEQVEWVRRRFKRARPATATSALPAEIGVMLASGLGDLGVPERRAGAALVVQNLSVHFGGVVAVDDFSLTLNYGEVVGLIGPNGAGKTTFIDAVVGMVPARPGTVILLDGQDIGSMRVHRRARAGLSRSFQSLELFEDMTVRENLQVACDDHSILPYLSDLARPSAPELSATALAAVQEFGLAASMDAKPGELPYGRRRLLAITRAVAASPAVLLLDEPAAGLSDGETRELGELISALARRSGIAVLMVEHDVGLVLSICDRVAVLDAGRKIAEGTPSEVAGDERVVAAYLGEPVAEESSADRVV